MLEEKIETFERNIARSKPAEPYAVSFGGELLTANAHRGIQLLRPRTREGVNLELDRLQALGLQSVTVAVSFPVLYKPFLTWNGNGASYDGLLAFYQWLAENVHRRRMKLVIESGTLFPGSYSVASGFKLAEYYRSLSDREFAEGRAAVAADIARLIRPDYLVVGSEPDTEAKLTGKQFLNTPAGFAALARQIVASVKRAGGGDVPIGAGIPTWQRGGETWIRDLLAAVPDLDFVDLHVYPVNVDLLDNLFRFTDLVHAAGKDVTICEAWLQKQRDTEFKQLDAAFDPTVFARNAFDFWAPLDARFLEAMVRFARANRVLVLSPYWSQHFHAYLDYEQVHALGAAEIVQRSYAAAAAAMARGEVSPTGAAYRRAIQ